MAETAADTEINADTDTGALGEDEWVDAYHLLYDVASAPPVSGDGETAAEVLEVFFEAHDRKVRIDEVGDVCASAGDAAPLTSHVDTVPGDAPVKIEDGML